MFRGSIPESFPRQVPHLPQCSYGLGYDICPTQCDFDERCGDELSALVRSELQTALICPFFPHL